MTERIYLFDTLQEKMRSSYAEATIDYVASIVFAEYDGTEQQLKETVEQLVSVFWNANKIVMHMPNSISSMTCIEFEKHEFSNSFTSWRDKCEQFVAELLRKKIRFDKMNDEGNGFTSKNGFEVYAK